MTEEIKEIVEDIKEVTPELAEEVIKDVEPEAEKIVEEATPVAINHVEELEKLFSNPDATLKDLGEALKKFELATMEAVNKLQYVLFNHDHKAAEVPKIIPATKF